MPALDKARRGAWTAAHYGTRALGRAGAAGLYDIGKVASVFVPALRGEILDASPALDEPDNGAAARYLSRPPRSVAPSPVIEGAFDPRPLPRRLSRTLVLRDARVVGKLGAVVEPRSGRLVFESAFGRSSQLVKMWGLRRARLLDAPRRVAGPLVFLPAWDSKNYFHFVVEIMSRLYAFSDDGNVDLIAFRERVAEITFILNEREPDWQEEIARLLGLSTRRVRLTDSTNWIVDPLVLPTFPGVRHPRQHAGTLIPPDILTWLRRLYREAAGVLEAAAGSRRLYVVRGETTSRRLRNERDVLALARRYGFEPIKAEEYREREKIRRFAEAEAVLAPHGAGLANTLFADRCVTIELFSPVYLVPSYYFMAEGLGHTYWYLVGALAPTKEATMFSDYEISLDQLDATLAAALD